jgi:Flp pilus assembly protein TadG
MRSRGAVSIEFALAMPSLLLVVFVGFELGRILITRHRLADATGYAVRAAAIVRPTPGPAAVQAAVQRKMGDELGRCASLQVQSTTEPGAYPGGQALRVVSTCQLVPVFNLAAWTALAPSQLTVTAAMPLNP